MVEAILGLLTTAKGAKFATFTYTNSANETAKYRVNLNVNYTRAYTRDLETLRETLPTLDGVDRVACEELIASLEKSLENGVGNNPDYRVGDAYTPVEGVSGVKVHTETGTIHLNCMLEEKEVIIPGQYKQVNSSAKTIAKNRLRRGLLTGKIRQFSLPSVTRAALMGEVLVLD